MSQLKAERCIPCEEGAVPLTQSEIDRLLAHIPAWRVVERRGIERLERGFAFDDFAQALEFANRVGEIAEAEGHHPAILVQWGKTSVSWWTHSIKGLHQNDFIMAARTSDLY